MQRVFYIPKEEVDKYNRMMRADHVDYEKNDIPRYALIDSWSVDLGDGYEADIRVCSSNYDDPLWCECLLYWHGDACGYTEMSDDLLGEYWFEHNGRQIVIIVEAE